MTRRTLDTLFQAKRRGEDLGQSYGAFFPSGSSSSYVPQIASRTATERPLATVDGQSST